MKTVSIRGTIVDAWFDHDFFAAEIEAGVLTPSSRFVREFRSALESGEDVAIEINSPGGDVFAGGEMLAAIQDAGERVAHISVGGLAASMAANIALMARRPLRVHTNSLLYFHSATSDVWGGPGAHSDEAALLEKVNAPMMNELVARGVDEERVLAGFEDGRNLVLDADEAREYLGAEIVGGAADLPAKADERTRERIQNPAANIDRLADYTATLAAVARLAAWTPDAPVAEENISEPPAAREVGKGEDGAPCVHGTDGGEVPSSGEGGEPAAPQTETPQPDAPADAGEGGEAKGAEGETPEPEPQNAPEPPKEAVADEERFASLEKQLRAVQSAATKRINAIKAECAREVEAKEAEVSALRAQVDNLTKQMETLADSLESARTAHNDLVSNVLSGTDEGMTWKRAVAEYGLGAALVKFPDLAAEYRAAYGRR